MKIHFTVRLLQYSAFHSRKHLILNVILFKRYIRFNINSVFVCVCLSQEDIKEFNECLEILHNCAQNPDLRRHFQKINAVDLLMTFIESEIRSKRIKKVF